MPIILCSLMDDKFQIYNSNWIKFYDPMCKIYLQKFYTALWNKKYVYIRVLLLELI
jgi:hypothetical protein